jgi:uncharacterized membrane protein (DUF106 family)
MEHPFYLVFIIALITTLLNLYYMVFVQRKHIQHLRDIAKRKKAKLK